LKKCREFGFVNVIISAKKFTIEMDNDYEFV